MENFTVEGLIEEIYRFTYKSLVEKRNYLRSDNTEEPLISYLTVLIKRKDKNKLPPISSPLIVSEGSKDSILPVLLQYNI